MQLPPARRRQAPTVESDAHRQQSKLGTAPDALGAVQAIAGDSVLPRVLAGRQGGPKGLRPHRRERFQPSIRALPQDAADALCLTCLAGTPGAAFGFKPK